MIARAPGQAEAQSPPGRPSFNPQNSPDPLF